MLREETKNVRKKMLEIRNTEKIFEVKPITSQKSFYGKAYIKTDGHGNYILYSYHTPVLACVFGKNYRLWSGYSATTMKHITAVSNISGKHEWETMETFR